MSSKIDMDFVEEKIKKFRIENGLPENFCPVPFRNAVFWPDGDVHMCRQNLLTLGSLTKQTFEEIWNGPKLQKIRADFLRGDYSICKHEISSSGCNKKQADMLFDSNDFSIIQKTPPRRITPNFDGGCNLRCSTCDHPDLSTSVYKDPAFIEYFEKKLLPSARYIELYGGEPFIKKDTFDLIKKSLDLSPGASWSFSTNGNWKLTTKISDLLDLISITWIAFSIDTLDPELYPKLRKHGNFEQMIETFTRMLEYNKTREKRGLKPFRVTINSLFYDLTWRSFPELVKYAAKLKINISFSFLVKPENMSVLNMSESERITMLEFYFEQLEYKDLNADAIYVLMTIWKSISPIERAALLPKFGKLFPGALL